ncbi:10519_t:CDS:2 [Acaulospora morrowiae]|uniref:10519_t:CDS:1 n=1 Tax=Acaulospora morrowiae TaxID=94023 RepID=A0A9N9HME6_9GLOM|nr:10519_t:CDS:2 [Acaulospora morrowiae]
MGWIDPREIQFGKQLGQGAFKTTYYGTYKKIPVAIGMLNHNVDRNDFEREIYILKNLNHENVIKFIGTLMWSRDAHNARCCIVTEYCDRGDLLNFMKKNGGHGLKLKIAKGIANGIEYLHARSIIHKDLKSDNILIKSSNRNFITVKISDFGVSRIKSNIEMMMSTRGALYWKAPEILGRNLARYNEKIDIYSAGLVFWEIFTWGREGFPYSNLRFINEEHFRRFIERGNRPSVNLLIQNNIGNSIIGLIQKMWETKPEKRPSIRHVVTTLSTLQSSHARR